MFKQEEHDHNKDSIKTFLHKWKDLNHLWPTLVALMAVETSFTLEGKAYKQGTSLIIETHPKSWLEFEAAFIK